MTRQREFFAEVVLPTVFIYRLQVRARSKREARRFVVEWMANDAHPNVQQLTPDFASQATGKPRINDIFELRGKHQEDNNGH